MRNGFGQNTDKLLHSVRSTEGILGLLLGASSLLQLGIEPDYETPVEDICHDAAKRTIPHSCILDILGASLPRAL